MVSAIQRRRPPAARAGPRGHRGRARAAAGDGRALRRRRHRRPAVLAIEVACSGGTYVRTLAADLGHLLGGGAHLRNLRRTAVGPYTIDEAAPPDECALLDPLGAVRGLAVLDVDDATAALVANGRVLPAPDGPGPWAVVAPGGRLLAVYEPFRAGEAKPAVVARRLTAALFGSGRRHRCRASVAGRAGHHRSRSAAVARRAHRGHDRRVRRCAPRAPGRHRRRAAPRRAGGRPVGRADVRPPPGDDRAPGVGAPAADLARAAPRAARRDRRRRHGDRARSTWRSPRSCPTIHPARARQGARREESSSSARTSTSAATARATSGCSRSTARTDDFVVDPIHLVLRADGIDEPISSTAIRRALAGGEVERAARMLGRQHEVRGTVVVGDQRGRLLGFPTANVEVPNAVVPARRRRLRRLVRAARRRRPPVRHQPRAPPDVLRARRPLAPRGPPPRLRRRPLRRAGRRSASSTSCAASASSTASTPSRRS